MDLAKLMADVGETTRQKGFNTGDHVTQLLLFVDEVEEAFEHISVTDGVLLSDKQERLVSIKHEVGQLMRDLKEIRKDTATPFVPVPSTIEDKEHLAEELADIIIRVLSYAYGNELPLIEALEAKAAKNKARPEKHGKAF